MCWPRTQQITNWTAPPFWTPGSISTADTTAAGGRTALGRQSLAGGATPLPFVALAPCRLVDTRGNAPLTGGFLPAATIRSYTLVGVCNVPPGAAAISLNATVVNAVGPGLPHALARGRSVPVRFHAELRRGQTVANAAVVPLSATGGISLAFGVSGGGRHSRHERLLRAAFRS